MFEISFPELVILGVIALLVLGPERLPKAARFAGLWMRRARAQWHSVKSELERELADEELRHSLEATRKALAEAESQLQSQAQDLQSTLEQPSTKEIEKQSVDQTAHTRDKARIDQEAKP